MGCVMDGQSFAAELINLAAEIKSRQKVAHLR